MKKNPEFVRFERTARKWLEKFGLNDWYVEIEAPGGFDGDHYATINYASDIRKAKIRWYGPKPAAPGHIILGEHISAERHALHEILHLLFADMAIILGQRGLNHDDSNKEEHKVIERLLRVLSDD